MSNEERLTITMKGGAPWGFRFSGGGALPLTVIKIRKGSRAQEQGLQEGDTVTSINGVQVHDKSQGEAQALVEESGDCVTLDVFRGGSDEVSHDKVDKSALISSSGGEEGSAVSYVITSDITVSAAEVDFSTDNLTSDIFDTHENYQEGFTMTSTVDDISNTAFTEDDAMSSPPPSFTITASVDEIASNESEVIHSSQAFSDDFVVEEIQSLSSFSAVIVEAVCDSPTNAASQDRSSPSPLRASSVSQVVAFSEEVPAGSVQPLPKIDTAPSGNDSEDAPDESLRLQTISKSLGTNSAESQVTTSSTLSDEATILTADVTPVLAADETPVLTADVTPVLTADETPVLTADVTPILTSDEATISSSNVTPVLTSDETPVVTSDETPVVTSDVTSVLTSDVSTSLISDETQVLTYDGTPVLASDVTPVLTADVTQVLTADVTPVLTSGEATISSSNVTPVLTSDETPVVTSDVTSVLTSDVSTSLISDETQVLTYDGTSILISDVSPALISDETQVLTYDGTSILTSDVSQVLISETPVLTSDGTSILTSDVSPALIPDETQVLTYDGTSILTSDVSSGLISDETQFLTYDGTSILTSDVSPALISDETQVLTYDGTSILTSDVSPALISDETQVLTYDGTSILTSDVSTSLISDETQVLTYDGTSILTSDVSPALISDDTPVLTYDGTSIFKSDVSPALISDETQVLTYDGTSILSSDVSPVLISETPVLIYDRTSVLASDITSVVTSEVTSILTFSKSSDVKPVATSSTSHNVTTPVMTSSAPSYVISPALTYSKPSVTKRVLAISLPSDATPVLTSSEPHDVTPTLTLSIVSDVPSVKTSSRNDKSNAQLEQSSRHYDKIKNTTVYRRITTIDASRSPRDIDHRSFQRVTQFDDIIQTYKPPTVYAIATSKPSTFAVLRSPTLFSNSASTSLLQPQTQRYAIKPSLNTSFVSSYIRAPLITHAKLVSDFSRTTIPGLYTPGIYTPGIYTCGQHTPAPTVADNTAYITRKPVFQVTNIRPTTEPETRSPNRWLPERPDHRADTSLSGVSSYPTFSPSRRGNSWLEEQKKPTSHQTSRNQYESTQNLRNEEHRYGQGHEKQHEKLHVFAPPVKTSLSSDYHGDGYYEDHRHLGQYNDSIFSPDSYSMRRKLYSGSTFDDVTGNSYPIIPDQAHLCKNIPQSLTSDANDGARNAKTFVKQRQHSNKFVHGGQSEFSSFTGDVANFRNLDSELSSDEDIANKPYLSYKAPEVKHHFGSDFEQAKMALTPDQFEKLRLYSKKCEHRAVTPEVCFDIAADLQAQKGRGGRLFQRRKQRVDQFIIDGKQLKFSPTTNKLESLLSVPACRKQTPWDAALESSRNVDTAYSHTWKDQTNPKLNRAVRSGTPIPQSLSAVHSSLKFEESPFVLKGHNFNRTAKGWTGGVEHRLENQRQLSPVRHQVPTKSHEPVQQQENFYEKRQTWQATEEPRHVSNLTPDSRQNQANERAQNNWKTKQQDEFSRKNQRHISPARNQVPTKSREPVQQQENFYEKRQTWQATEEPRHVSSLTPDSRQYQANERAHHNWKTKQKDEFSRSKSAEHINADYWSRCSSNRQVSRPESWHSDSYGVLRQGDGINYAYVHADHKRESGVYPNVAYRQPIIPGTDL